MTTRNTRMAEWLGKRNKQLLCGVAAVAFLAVGGLISPAGAADVAYETPGPTFDGFYVGGHAGYGQADFEGCDSSPSTCDPFLEVDTQGFLAGVHAGWNFQPSPSWLLGIETDVSLTPGWSGKEATCTSCSSGVSGSLDALASIRGRLGFTFDRALIYATGGVAFAQSNAIGASTPDNFATSPDIVTGWVGGGGIEFMATENASLRLEGLFYGFDEERHDKFSSGVAGIDDAWVVRAGASWYFN